MSERLGRPRHRPVSAWGALEQEWADLQTEVATLRHEVADLREQIGAAGPSTAGRLWFDVAQAAEHAGRHAVTVRKALASGELHGHQSAAGGRWRIHAECLDAWCRKSPCGHADPGSSLSAL